MCNIWGSHNSVVEDSGLGLSGFTCLVTQHHILEDLCLEISVCLLQTFKRLCMWLIAWKDFIALGCHKSLILNKLSNFKCSYYCQSTMYELDEEEGILCQWKLLVFESVTSHEVNGKWIATKNVIFFLQCTTGPASGHGMHCFSAEVFMCVQVLTFKPFDQF